ncbi:MAG: CHASE domain-containing protein, partial [Gammaproteobacteria bacterium]
MFSPILERLSRILYSPQFLAGLVFIVSLSLTYTLWRQARLDTVRELRSEFDLRARETVNMIEQRIAANGLVLRGVRGLFDSSVNIDRDEFRNYVTSLRLDGRFLGMPSVGYAKLVDESRQDDLISDMRLQGHDDFTFQPAAGGGTSANVVFLEPLFFGGTGPEIGNDLFSDPVQRAAMEKARDTGGVAVTGRLPQNTDGEGFEKSAFLMFVPLYRHGMPHEILADRRSHIVGWVFSICLVDKMMEGIGGERAGDLDIEIYDGEKISDETRLYRYNRRVGNVGSDTFMFDKSWPIEVGGRTWTIFIHSLPVFEGRLNKGNPLIISTAGVVLSLLLTLLIRSLMLAKRMACDLSESEKRFRIIFEQAAVGVAFIETASGVFLNVNRRYCDILNLPAGEMNEASLKAITDPDDWQ